MNQEEILAKIEKSAHSRPGAFGGAFIFVLGCLMLVLSVASFLEAFKPDIAPEDVAGIGTLITLLLGVGAIYLGWRLMFRRPKMTADDLSATLDFEYYVTVLRGGRVVTPAEKMHVTVSPEGIHALPEGGSDTSALAIRWADITKTRWRMIYAFDGYQLDTGGQTIVFLASDPLDERHRYINSFMLGFGLGDAAALRNVPENLRLVRRLTALHAYAKAYNPKATTYWANASTEGTIARSVVILLAFAVGTYWTMLIVDVVVGDPQGKIANNIGIVAVLIGFIWLMSVMNKEYRFSQIISGKKGPL